MSRLLSIKKVLTIFLVIASVKAGAQHALYYQGFEGDPCENWTYSGGVPTSGVQRTGSHSGRTGYMNNTLQFSPADVTGYSGLVLTIYHSVKPGPGPGMDTREGAVIQLSLNGGAYTTIGSVGGFGDANWTFSSPTGGSATGSAGCTIYRTPNPLVLNIPDGTTSVQVKVVSIRAGSCGSFNNAMSNATPSLYDRSDEGFYIDDVQITTTTPLPPVQLTSAPGTDAQEINSCIPVPITDIQYSTGPGVVNVTGLPPGVAYNYVNGIVTISGSPATDGVYNYTVTNICTDSFATGSITKTTPQPVTQTADTSGCNSVVYNGTTYTSSAVVNETIKSYQGCDSIYKVTNITITPIVPVTQTTDTSGCNSVVFNGTTYTASTVLNETIKSYQGCDSIYKVTNVIVTPIVPVTQTTDTSGCNSVVFNGTTYTASTVLNETIKSYQGCDSIYKVINIIVTPIVPVTQTTDTSGCNSVVFNGTTYTASTVLNETIKSYQGCDSIYKVTNITITPIVPVTQTTDTSGCNSVVYNGTTYTSSTVVNETVKSYQGCDSIYKVINIIVTPIVPVTQTTDTSGCNSVVYNGTTYTSSIVVNETVKSYQGCDSIYKVINIIVTPIVPVTQTTDTSGCNSVVFNGTIYTASTVLNETIKSYQGCDSVYKITNIIVTPIVPVTQTTDTSGCNSVVFNGTTYTASTVLNETIKSYQGCDSIYKVTNIIVTPIVPVTQTTDTSGCNSVVFNGTTYTAPTVLNETIKSYQGCDSIYKIINIIVTPIVPVTQTTDTSGCNAVVYNSTTYTSSTVVNETVKSYQGCDSIYKVTNITITPIVPVTQTTDTSGCNSVVFNGTTYTSSTVLSETIKSYQGCDSIYKVTNIIVTPVVPVTQTTDTSGCNSVVYNGTTYTSSTVLNETVKSYQGCDSIYKVTNIIVTPIVPVTQTTDTSGCNSVVYNGTTYTSSTVVNETVKSYQGCDSVYKIINIIVTPIVPVTQTTDTSGCNSVVFNGTTYTASTVLNETIKSYQGCDSIYKVTNITITPIVPVTQTTDTSGCNSVVFNGTTYTVSTVLNETIKSYQGCDSVYKVTNIVVTPVIPIPKDTIVTGCGRVIFNGITYISDTEINDTIKSAGGCDSVYRKVNIVITPDNFILNLTSSVNNINPGLPVTLNTSSISNYTVISWQPFHIFPLQSVTTQNIFSDTTMNILVTAKSDKGCIGSATLLLTVNKLQDDIYFPSAFNPTSTVGNHSFGPLGRLSQLKDYSLLIYNRWGEVVFVSTDPFQKWNGIYKGVLASPGNFVWQASYLYRGTFKKTRRGNILLIK